MLMSAERNNVSCAGAIVELKTIVPTPPVMMADSFAEEGDVLGEWRRSRCGGGTIQLY
jgi:hypothetical protein